MEKLKHLPKLILILSLVCFMSPTTLQAKGWGVGKKIVSGAKKVGGGVKKAAGKVGGGIKKAASWTGKTVKKGATGVGRGVSSAAKGVGKAGAWVGKGIGKGAKGVGKGVVGAAKGIGKAGAWVGKGIGKGAKGVGKGVVGAAKGIGKAGAWVGKGIGKGVVGAAKGIGKAGAWVGKGVGKGVVGAAKGIGKAGAWVGKGIAGGVKGVGSKIFGGGGGRPISVGKIGRPALIGGALVGAGGAAAAAANAQNKQCQAFVSKIKMAPVNQQGAMFDQYMDSGCPQDANVMAMYSAYQSKMAGLAATQQQFDNRLGSLAQRRMMECQSQGGMWTGSSCQKGASMGARMRSMRGYRAPASMGSAQSRAAINPYQANSPTRYAPSSGGTRGYGSPYGGQGRSLQQGYGQPQGYGQVQQGYGGY